MNQTQQTETKPIKEYKLATFVIIVGIILTALSPLLFTQFSSGISFTQTGQIGDTMGGLTAPIIGCMSAILVYFAFKAQVRANEAITRQFNIQMEKLEVQGVEENLLKRIQFLRDDLHNFRLGSKQGQDAIDHVLHTYSLFVPNSQPPENIVSGTRALKAILDQFIILVRDVNRAPAMIKINLGKILSSTYFALIHHNLISRERLPDDIALGYRKLYNELMELMASPFDPVNKTN